ncbi:MAG: hypothetical protein IPM84_23220 [Anaerolineae bacterium]|nr:hypothetical protein [Anaerolineae bacterium]
MSFVAFVASQSCSGANRRGTTEVVTTNLAHLHVRLAKDHDEIDARRSILFIARQVREFASPELLVVCFGADVLMEAAITELTVHRHRIAARLTALQAAATDLTDL